MKLKKIGKNIFSVMISLIAVFALVLTPVNAAVIEAQEIKVSEIGNDYLPVGTKVRNDTGKDVEIATYIEEEGNPSLQRNVVQKIVSGETFTMPQKFTIVKDGGTTFNLETASIYWTTNAFNAAGSEFQVYSLTDKQIMERSKQTIYGGAVKAVEGRFNSDFDNLENVIADIVENVKAYLEREELPSDNLSFKWKEAPTIVKATSKTEVGSHEGIIVVTRGSESIEIGVKGEVWYDEPTVKAAFTSGANSTWNKGSTKSLTFKVNKKLDDIVALKVDGKAIDSDHVTVDDKTGSLVITMKPAYLQGLSTGKHKLEVVYTDILLTTNFTVKSGSPKTDDTTNTMFLLAMFGMSALATYVIRKKKYNN